MVVSLVGYTCCFYLPLLSVQVSCRPAIHVVGLKNIKATLAMCFAGPLEHDVVITIKLRHQHLAILTAAHL